MEIVGEQVEDETSEVLWVVLVQWCGREKRKESGFDRGVNPGFINFGIGRMALKDILGRMEK